MKECCVCHAVLPISEYYPYSKDKSRPMAYCKNCHKLRMRQATLKYADKRKAARAIYRMRPKVKAREMATTKKMYSLYREKQLARMKVYNAVKNGKLKRLACWCGDIKVQAHHDDYNKPLEVRWLCRRHHNEVHGKTGLIRALQ